jgi:hypothetical protein
MSELPAGDPHEIIHTSGPAVVVPLAEYRRLRLAEQIADPEAWLDAVEEAGLADEEVLAAYLARIGRSLEEIRDWNADGRRGAVSYAEARRRVLDDDA